MISAATADALPLPRLSRVSCLSACCCRTDGLDNVCSKDSKDADESSA